MPVPKYVSKKKRKQWIKEHKKIVKALKGKKNTIKFPYAVATAKITKEI